MKTIIYAFKCIIIYNHMWGCNHFCVVVVELICIDMHHCVVSLKKEVALVQKGVLMTCPKLKRVAHGFIRGTRFLREPIVKLVPHA